MNKTLKTLIIILIPVLVLLFIIIGVSIALITKSISNASNMEYYNIGNDKITSITKVVGKRKVSRISTHKSKGVATKEYQYINIKDTRSDIDTYVNELKKDNYINTTNIDLTRRSGTIELATYSVDSDNIIIIDISYNLNSYTITIKKGPGSIQSYD